MLAAYVILDGFDLGAGALHLFVARTDAERRQVLAAIGPFWDGNEVWLLALGGVLFVAFPHVLASGLSGFYFAIFLVLWVADARAVSHRVPQPPREPSLARRVGRRLLGRQRAAAGPLRRRARQPPPRRAARLLRLVRDRVVHGLQCVRSRWASWTGTPCSSACLRWPLSPRTARCSSPGRPTISFRRARVSRRRGAICCVAIRVAAPDVDHVGRSSDLFGMLAAPADRARDHRDRDGRTGDRRIRVTERPVPIAFIGSSAFLVGVLAATAASVFPVMLRATGGDSLSLTAYNAGAPPASLRIGAWMVARGIPDRDRLLRHAVPAAQGQGAGGSRTRGLLITDNALTIVE